MEFKDLTLKEIVDGYSGSEDKECQCIFCGKVFKKGIIYNSRGNLVDHIRGIKEHIVDEHGGVFYELIGLDKQVSGVSDVQKEILIGTYEEKSNKEMSEEMGINVTTVRAHKFNLQKAKREAKILLAILEHIENEHIVEEQKELQLQRESRGSKLDDIISSDSSVGNNLHPFFTNFSLK